MVAVWWRCMMARLCQRRFWSKLFQVEPFLRIRSRFKDLRWGKIQRRRRRSCFNFYSPLRPFKRHKIRGITINVLLTNAPGIFRAAMPHTPTVEIVIMHCLIWQFKGLLNGKILIMHMHYDNFDCTTVHFFIMHVLIMHKSHNAWLWSWSQLGR